MSSGAFKFLKSRKRMRGRRIRKGGIAKQALALAKKNRREIKRDNEIQYTQIDSGASGVALTTAPAIELLNRTSWTVTSNTCMFKGIEILGTIQPTPASTGQDRWRIDIVLDKRPDGVILDLADIYGSTTPKINVLVNTEERGRYRVIKTWRGTFNVITDKAVSGARNITLFKRFNMKIIIDVADSAVAQGSIQTNAVYLVAWTEATANQPVLDLSIIAKHTE